MEIDGSNDAVRRRSQGAALQYGFEPCDFETRHFFIELGLSEFGLGESGRRLRILDRLLTGDGLRPQRSHSLELGRGHRQHGRLELDDRIGRSPRSRRLNLGFLHAGLQLSDDLAFPDFLRPVDFHGRQRSLRRDRKLVDVVRTDQARRMARIVGERLAPGGVRKQHQKARDGREPAQSRHQSKPPAKAISFDNCSSRRNSCNRPLLLRFSDKNCDQEIATPVNCGQRVSNLCQYGPRKRSALSSRETNSSTRPGSPWRAQRPINCRSTRRESWRSHRMTTSPPSSATPEPSLMSVPRPAILVTTVMTPCLPALATISASVLSCAALRTLCGTPSAESAAPARSASPTLRTATSAGRPRERRLD